MTSRLKIFRNAKRAFLRSWLVAIVFWIAINPARAFDSEATRAILYDVTNDSILYAKDAEAAFAPASLAKLMTLGVVFDEMDRGWLAPGQPFKLSEHAWRTGGGPARTTSMFAKVNSEIAVQDLVRGVAIVIGNDAAIALAEGIAKSESAFAERMNRLGQEIGLTASHFVNATGLPQDGQRTSVHDLLRVSIYLTTRHSERYRVFSQPDLDWNRIRQTNRNPLLNQYEGTDGLMVGFTAGQGHMIAASAVRGGKRMIAVLAGLPDEATRNRAAQALLDWGFDGHIQRELFEAGAVVAEARIFGGTKGSVRLVSPDAVHLLMPKDGDSRLVARAVYRGPIAAPVSRGDRVGSLRIWRDGMLQREVPLIADEDVSEGSLLRRALDATYELGANAVGAVYRRVM
ncbi:D-alanyl-D-alanine carboxypeptidase family protein [Terrihabitans sp. B22-R8]|uniref:D-alanyl-D-alanine carboxypeptidase family protein n=1 Tax=Terrihabitans sp. B22-R8 TaxID=3425128 RepID=UPI00403CE6D9